MRPKASWPEVEAHRGQEPLGPAVPSPRPPPLHHAPFTLCVSGALVRRENISHYPPLPLLKESISTLFGGRMGLSLSGCEGKAGEEEGKN